MNNITVSMTDTNNIQHDFSNIISLKITKEYFLPYTNASVSLITDANFFQYKDIFVSVNGFNTHYGLIDDVNYCKKSDYTILTITSKSFSSLLLQNQPVPGFMYNVSLDSLMDSFIDIPYVTHEPNNTIQNYIFIKENESLWDAVVNISYKVSGIYPYIRNNNRIYISSPENLYEFSLDDKNIISHGLCLDYKNIVSDYHMQDIEGNYDVFKLHNSNAESLNIIRHRQIPLDKQYLSNPEQGMHNRLEYSMRGCYAEYWEYNGFSGEDICDTFNNGKRIDKIVVTGNSNGIKTRLYNYTAFETGT